MPRNRIAPKAPSPAADLSLDETVLVDVLALTDALWTPFAATRSSATAPPVRL